MFGPDEKESTKDSSKDAAPTYNGQTDADLDKWGADTRPAEDRQHPRD